MTVMNILYAIVVLVLMIIAFVGLLIFAILLLMSIFKVVGLILGEIIRMIRR